MMNLNFESYFKDTDNRYYDSKYIITILENILGNKLDNIKNNVSNTQVVVTKEQIVEFLEKRFEEEEPELKKKIESPKSKRSGNFGRWTDKDIKSYSQEFIDGLSAERYYFEPYSLEYFNRYSNIVRDKALLLLNIIDKIGNRDTISIQDLITELDIQLDENGNISKEDIIRLITPTVYNIGELNEKVSEANNLSTYLTFKMSKHSLYKDGWSEGEIYPSSSLQIKSLHYAHVRGNVPLSSAQRDELEQEKERSRGEFVKMLFD